jgi:hypothetical protein
MRLDATIKFRDPQVDFAYVLTDIGLLSHLELWLGIIVACMPTLAPLLNRYIKPAISKVSGKVRSGDQVHMQNRPRTFGSAERQGQRQTKKPYTYSNTGDDETDEEQLHITPPAPVAVTTECAYQPKTDSSQELKNDHHAIYIQQAWETHDTAKSAYFP